MIYNARNSLYYVLCRSKTIRLKYFLAPTTILYCQLVSIASEKSESKWLMPLKQLTLNRFGFEFHKRHCICAETIQLSYWPSVVLSRYPCTDWHLRSFCTSTAEQSPKISFECDVTITSSKKGIWRVNWLIYLYMNGQFSEKRQFV
jgi:hypothetical protein